MPLCAIDRTILDKHAVLMMKLMERGDQKSAPLHVRKSKSINVTLI